MYLAVRFEEGEVSRYLPQVRRSERRKSLPPESTTDTSQVRSKDLCFQKGEYVPTYLPRYLIWTRFEHPRDTPDQILPLFGGHLGFAIVARFWAFQYHGELVRCTLSRIAI